MEATMDLAIWMVIIPLISAFLSGIIHHFKEEFFQPFILTSGFFYLLIALTHILFQDQIPYFYNVGGWEREIAINLAIDSFTMVMFVIMTALVMLIYMYASARITERKSKFFLLMNILLVGVSGMVMTADLFNLYVFFEITSISSYSLVAFNDDDASIEAAYKYLIIGTISGIFLLLAIVLTYQATGTLNMGLIPERLATVNTMVRNVLLSFYVIGLGVKFALVPLHTWLPDAYVGVPISYNILSSGLVIKACFFALMRILYIFFGVEFLQEFSLNTIISFWGAITIIFGHSVAFRQSNVKRIMGYSTIAQMGYIMVAFGLGTAAGIIAGSFHLINHAIMKSTIFFATGNLAKVSGGYHLEDFRGVGGVMPKTSMVFVFSLLALVGLPPFNGFVSKWMILQAAAEANYYFPALMVIVGSVISLGYYLGIIKAIFTAPRVEVESLQLPSFTISEELPPFLLGSICVITGILPMIILNVIDQSPQFLLERANFITTILGGG